MLQKDVCLNCFESVREPICPECLWNQVMLWMNDAQVPEKIQKKISKKISGIYNKRNANFPLGSDCIICNKEMYSMCTKCYFKDLTLIIKKTIETEKVIQHNFTKMFSFKIYEIGSPKNRFISY